MVEKRKINEIELELKVIGKNIMAHLKLCWPILKNMVRIISRDIYSLCTRLEVIPITKKSNSSFYRMCLNHQVGITATSMRNGRKNLSTLLKAEDTRRL